MTARDAIIEAAVRAEYERLLSGNTYLAINRDLPLNGEGDISRTVQITPTLLADVDAYGYVVGVESLTGDVGVAEMILIFQTLPVDPTAGGTR